MPRKQQTIISSFFEKIPTRDKRGLLIFLQSLIFQKFAFGALNVFNQNDVILVRF